MPELKMEQITAWEVDYSDWDRYVNDYFGFEKKGYFYPYEFVADHEANNDSIYEFNPNGKELHECDRKEIEKWIKNPNSSSYMTHTIFDYIVSKGDLPKGTYYIK